MSSTIIHPSIYQGKHTLKRARHENSPTDWALTFEESAGYSPNSDVAVFLTTEQLEGLHRSIFAALQDYYRQQDELQQDVEGVAV